MSKFQNILILAGGDSSRFWPLQDKNMYSFLGTPILAHQINSLLPYGEKVYVVIPSQLDTSSITSHISSTEITFIRQKDELPGQAGAILSAEDNIVGEVLIVNANDIFDVSILNTFLTELEKGKKDVILLAKKVTSYFPGGYVKYENGKILEIVEKPKPEHVPSDIVKLVVDYVGSFKGLVDVIDMTETKEDNRYELSLNILLKSNNNTSLVLYEKYWHPFKYPWHMLDMMKYFMGSISQNIDPSAKISEKAIIVQPVVIGKNVKVGDFTKIVGPCYIGENTIIGDYAMVRDSHIGAHSLIGGYSEVARSYLGEGVMLHRNYVGDSVLDDNVLMGAGAVTANFRFDQKNVKSLVRKNVVDTEHTKLGTIIGKGSKIGVNSTILPGVKIGKNTFITPHSLIQEDIEDNVFLHQGKKEKNKSA
ncbi:MAG: sugar phosphate nucleotidyltransferase [bacterium]|nr:sugar phosphate nucleotidyltransferase [bacterium]